MLSYRHSYHAGNYADVLKHIIICEIFKHLTKKDKAFTYIDTHAGAGLYDLQSDHSGKLQEYTKGIAKLNTDNFPELKSYFDAIQNHNPSTTLRFYPGSPLIAKHFLRTQDKASLFELHPTDYELLKNNSANDRRINTFQEDGFKGLLALLPPSSRRGLILIDPSYEIKTDYAKIYSNIEKAYQKFSTGVYAIWYPVVERQRIEALEKKLIQSNIKNIQRFELGLSADSETRGMTASGMIVINPPWELMKTMSNLLPKVVAALKENDNAFFKCDTLSDE